MQGIAVGVKTRVQVDAGNDACVPDDDIANLSYYLYCIDKCVPGVIDSDLIAYQNSRYFTSTTIEKIIVLTSILDPSVLEGRVIKRLSDYDFSKLETRFTNTFMTVTEKTDLTYLNIDQEGAVGLNLSHSEVTKVLIYRQCWLDYYYNTPIRNIAAQLRRIQEQKRRGHVALPINDYSYNYQRYDYDEDSTGGVCFAYIGFFLITLIFSICGCACGFHCFKRQLEGRNGAVCVLAMLALFLNFDFWLQVWTGNIDLGFLDQI